MLFNLKSAVILGLVAVSYATPIDLARRQAPIKGKNCNGRTYTRDDIYNAIQASYTQHGRYPEQYGNAEQIFNTEKQLYAYPLGWSGNGEPGADRVVFSTENDQNDQPKHVFRGAMYHPPGTGDSFIKCT